ncbi:MAG: flagellar biosynthesis protein FlhB [Firmicutes bacterium]|nr:flagellar biosynthesis protein FlhB [Bacillota bacterium]
MPDLRLEHIQLQIFALDKTEPATPKRRSEARKRGQIPRTQELNTAVVLLALFALIHAGMPGAMARIQDYMASTFGSLGAAPASVAGLHVVLFPALEVSALLLGPVLFVALVASVLSSGLQVGVVLTGEPLKPQFSRINPLEGAKRLFSRRGLVELGKSLLKIVIVGGMAYWTLAGTVPIFLNMNDMPVSRAFLNVNEIIYDLALRCGVALLVLAAADYAFQRWENEQSLKMTKEEIKEELKETEGNPQVRGKIRQMQRRLAVGRMMQQVPTADVVVTNPTHYAVALRYDPDTMEAPVVVAKGADFLALRIRTLAARHGVLIVENPALARTLYQAVDVGQAIPVELYQAVAEVLAFVFRLKGKTVS